MEVDWTQMRAQVASVIDAKISPIQDELSKQQELLDRLESLIGSMTAKTTIKSSAKAEAKTEKVISKIIKTVNGKTTVEDAKLEPLEVAEVPKAEHSPAAEQHHETIEAIIESQVEAAELSTN